MKIDAQRQSLVGVHNRDARPVRNKAFLKAAAAWSVWEGSTSKLYPDLSFIEHYGSAEFAEAFARIECHYFINKIWMKSDNQIIDNIPRIRHIPCEIVQGRYDVVCPAESAYLLNQAWPESTLHMVADAGHSAKEPGIAAQLIACTQKFKSL